VWTTDKDGLILCLLAAEMIAATGRDAASWYEELTNEMGKPFYTRVDLPATAAQKNALQALRADSVTAKDLAGEPITAKLTHAPGNGAAIGGLKVAARSGWFAVRPSGTEDLCKIYAESLRSQEHLTAIKDQAAAIMQSVFAAANA
jgi:phosphoglucomutase